MKKALGVTSFWWGLRQNADIAETFYFFIKSNGCNNKQKESIIFMV